MRDRAGSCRSRSPPSDHPTDAPDRRPSRRGGGGGALTEPGGGTALEYLCLIFETCREEYDRFTGDLRASGHLVAAQRLAPPEEAITVRVRRGRIGTTCGPFSEAGERLVGYCVIEARDLNGAIQVASRISGARFGCVEVRPVAEDAGMLPALGPPRPGDPT